MDATESERDQTTRYKRAKSVLLYHGTVGWCLWCYWMSIEIAVDLVRQMGREDYHGSYQTRFGEEEARVSTDSKLKWDKLLYVW